MDWRIFGGGAPFVQFSDTLLRTVTASLGTPWVYGYADPTQVGFFTPTGGITANNTTGLTLRNPTGGGSVCCMQIIPVTSIAWRGKDQFSEVKLVATNGAGFDGGPAVAMVGDSSVGTQNGYEGTVESGPIFGSIVSNIGGRAVVGAVAVAINDVLRISIAYSAASNLVKLWQNGVVVASATDNNAARPLSGDGGMPGIYWRGDTPASSVSFTNFRCGLGDGT